MTVYYIKRVLEILQKEGFVGFLETSARFVLRRLDPQHHLRFHFHTLKNYLYNHIRYDAPPNPYQSISVEATSIDHRLRRQNDSMVIPQTKHRGIGHIRGGDWDTYEKDLENTSDGRGCIIKGFRQRFELGMDWEDTVLYDFIISSYNGEKECYNINEYLNDRINSNNLLYEKIVENGYLSGHKSEPMRPGASEPIESVLEVLVVIDRDGDIYLFGGYHRFSIARILEIEIPVQVVCRHKQWQKIRDDIYNNGLSEENEQLRDHPDLQDVINN